jgi:hypothetical protein
MSMRPLSHTCSPDTCTCGETGYVSVWDELAELRRDDLEDAGPLGLIPEDHV